jgi:hypothetical protein
MNKDDNNEDQATGEEDNVTVDCNEKIPCSTPDTSSLLPLLCQLCRGNESFETITIYLETYSSLSFERNLHVRRGELNGHSMTKLEVVADL